jgi:hypothetical protein
MIKFSWGKGIFIAYAGFAIAVIIMVTISMTKNVDLVAPNYYEKEIKYQGEIDRINNTNRLKEQVKFEISEPILILSFPANSISSVITGDVVFYRPSDSKKDFKVNIKSDKQFRHSIDLSGIEKGLWKIKVIWNMDGTDYLSTSIYMKQ